MRKNGKFLKASQMPAGVKRVQRIRKKAKKRKRGKIHVLILCMITAMISMLANACLTRKSEAAQEEEIVEMVPLEENVIPLAVELSGIHMEPNGEESGRLEKVNEDKAREEYVGDLMVAAYCSCQACIGKTEMYVTWSGRLPIEGVTVAADLTEFEIDDMLRIGQNVYRVEDKVPSGARETLCLYFSNHAEAIAFGRQILPVFKVEAREEHSGEPLGIFGVTGYCNCEKCCGVKKERLTKTETIPKAGYTIAADPEVLPMGSKVEIDGITYIVEDTGKSVKGNVIDIYFDTHEEAVIYGRQKKNVYLVP